VPKKQAVLKFKGLPLRYLVRAQEAAGLQLQRSSVCYSYLVLTYMMTNKAGAGRVTWVKLSNCHQDLGSRARGLNLGQIVI